MRWRAGSGAAFSADVELPVSAQALQAAYSLLLGAALGVLYDLNRAFRRACGRAWLRSVWDAMFCLAAAWGLFAFALGEGEGRLRLFMLCCA